MQQHDNQQWREIATTQSEHEISQGHAFWLWAYRIGIGGSFTALAMFIVERMAGTEAQIWEWTGGQYLNGFIGLVFAFAFSAFIYGFYLTDYSIKQRLFIFSVAVCFPLFAEVSQTMHRGEESQKASSQASPEFLAAQQVLSAMTGTNPATGNAQALAVAQGDKARHESELAACSRYTTAERRAKCERYESAKIAEAEGKIQGYSTAGNAALNAHQAGITNMIGQIKELGNNADHSHAMVKLFMQFGASLLVASLIMAILIIGSIEAALAWLGDHVKNHQKAMRARGLEIGNQKKAVVKTAIVAESSPSLLAESSAPVSAFNTLANSARQTVGEYALKMEAGLKASPEIIATEYARADYANKQVMADMANFAGKIGSKLDELNKPSTIETDSFKQSPEQLANVERLHKEQVAEYERAKLAEMNGKGTIAYLTNKLSVEETVINIKAKVKASGATDPATIKAAVFDAYASMENPAPLSDHILERIADKIVIHRVHTVAPTKSDRAHTVADTQSDRAHTVAADPNEIANRLVMTSIYSDWLAAIHDGTCKKTVRATRDWVQKRCAGNQSHKTSINPKEYASITTMLFSRAVNDANSNITLNPDYKPGGRNMYL